MKHKFTRRHYRPDLTSLRPLTCKKKPFICIAAGYVPDGLHSMERYTDLLCSALDSRGVPYRICRPRQWLGKSWLPTKLGRYFAFLDKFVIFPWILWLHSLLWARAGLLLIHVPDQGNALYLTLLGGKKTLVTCHDFIAIQSSLGMGDNPRHSLVQAFILRCLKRAGAYVFVSCQTQKVAVTLLGEKACSGVVVYNPLSPKWSTQDYSLADAPPSLPFLLHVGNSAWYKNRLGLFKIYAVLRGLMPHPPPLHLYGQPLQFAEAALLGDLNLTQYVTCYGNPTDEAIHLAYLRADALLFPSLEEGFGWPPLEAMACGCPVFASNRPPLTEIGGDAIEYIDPCDPHQAATHIATCLQLGEPWRMKRAAAGRARAAEFSVQKFTSEMLAVYDTVVTGRCPEYQCPQSSTRLF